MIRAQQSISRLAITNGLWAFGPRVRREQNSPKPRKIACPNAERSSTGFEKNSRG